MDMKTPCVSFVVTNPYDEMTAPEVAQNIGWQYLFGEALTIHGNYWVHDGEAFVPLAKFLETHSVDDICINVREIIRARVAMWI